MSTVPGMCIRGLFKELLASIAAELVLSYTNDNTRSSCSADI